MSSEKVSSFWEWLGENAPRIECGLERGSKRVEQELATRFEKAYPGLAWEVTAGEGERWLFCVSANGDRELFPRVKQAVREAPKLTGWKIQAFRQRGALDVEISMAGQKLDCDQIWCQVESARGGVNLVLHIRGVTRKNAEAVSHMAGVLLDNAVGEYDAVMKIADLDFAPLERTPKASARFFPLRDLPAFLDHLKG